MTQIFLSKSRHKNLREQLKQKLDPELFEQLDVQMQMMRYSTWRTDWPPPDILNDYSPDERATIMAAVKNRTEASALREQKIADRAQLRMDRAQWFGFITGLAGIGGAVFLGNGPAQWATTTLGVVIVLVCIGGPNVARLIADRFYMQSLHRPPQQDPSKSRR